jgi:hypothetical protein
VVGFFKHGDEPSGSIKKAGFFVSFLDNILRNGVSYNFNFNKFPTGICLGILVVMNFHPHSFA